MSNARNFFVIYSDDISEFYQKISKGCIFDTEKYLVWSINTTTEDQNLEKMKNFDKCLNCKKEKIL